VNRKQIGPFWRSPNTAHSSIGQSGPELPSCDRGATGPFGNQDHPRAQESDELKSRHSGPTPASRQPCLRLQISHSLRIGFGSLRASLPCKAMVAGFSARTAPLGHAHPPPLRPRSGHPEPAMKKYAPVPQILVRDWPASSLITIPFDLFGNRVPVPLTDSPSRYIVFTAINVPRVTQITGGTFGTPRGESLSSGLSTRLGETGNRCPLPPIRSERPKWLSPR